MRKLSFRIGTLGSPAVTSGLLLLLALLIVQGTLYQAIHGMYEAQHHIFDAWIVLLGGSVPFPGVKLVLALLAVNLLAAASRFKISVKNAGMIMIHGGIALLLAGALAGSLARSEATLTLGKGEFLQTAASEDGRVIELPVGLTLNDFHITCFPGTDSPRDYESLLHAKGKGIDRDIVISMNRPFRYRDYTFYQSSYAVGDAGPVSVLSVVKNPFRALPPLAGIIIALGLALHFLLRAKKWSGRIDE